MKKYARPNLIVTVVVILAIAIGSWYAYHHSQNKASTSNTVDISKNWATYQNTQYGFELKYPPSWGKPVLQTGKTQTGASYTVTFPTLTKIGKTYVSTSVYMDPNNTAATKKSIQTQIKGATKGSLITDSTSYAQVLNSSNLGLSSLSLYQIVSIPKLGLSGVVLYFQIPQAAHDCPQNKLSSNANCVSESDYNTINAVAKSMKAE